MTRTWIRALRDALGWLRARGLRHRHLGRPGDRGRHRLRGFLCRGWSAPERLHREDDENTFSNNTTDVIWQGCDGVDEPIGIDEAPVVDYCPAYNHRVASLEFSFHMEEAEALE